MYAISRDPTTEPNSGSSKCPIPSALHTQVEAVGYPIGPLVCGAAGCCRLPAPKVVARLVPPSCLQADFWARLVRLSARPGLSCGSARRRKKTRHNNLVRSLTKRLTSDRPPQLFSPSWVTRKQVPGLRARSKPGASRQKVSGQAAWRRKVRRQGSGFIRAASRVCASAQDGWLQKC